jgi:hypothetical protein
MLKIDRIFHEKIVLFIKEAVRNFKKRGIGKI